MPRKGAAPRDSTPSTDGRRLRAQRSRDAIVESFLALLREGEAKPSSTRIAERAGVTQRTLFNHFADMDALLAAAAGRQAERVVALAPGPVEGDLEARLDAYVVALAEVLEDTMDVRWAAVLSDIGARAGFDVLRTARDFYRARTQRCFEPEFAQMTGAERAEVLHTFDVLNDAAVWRIRRLQHGQTVDQASRAVRRTIAGLLAPHARD